MMAAWWHTNPCNAACVSHPPPHLLWDEEYTAPPQTLSMQLPDAASTARHWFQICHDQPEGEQALEGGHAHHGRGAEHG